MLEKVDWRMSDLLVRLARRAGLGVESQRRMRVRSAEYMIGGDAGSVCAFQQDALVLVVDDDACLRAGIESLFQSIDVDVRTFASADAFLEFSIPDRPSCLVLDVCLHDSNGLDLQAKMKEAGARLPVVFISGYSDVPTSVAAMRAGATHFLTKPLRDHDLLDAVSEALRRDVQRRYAGRRRSELSMLFNSLTPREREIMCLVTAGRLNKQIADEVGLSLVTVKLHRAQAMRKMRASSFADLVVMSHILGFCEAPAASEAHEVA